MQNTFVLVSVGIAYLEDLATSLFDLLLRLLEFFLRGVDRALLGGLGVALIELLLLLPCADRRDFVTEVLGHGQRVAPHVEIEFRHVFLELTLHDLHREAGHLVFVCARYSNAYTYSLPRRVHLFLRFVVFASIPRR